MVNGKEDETKGATDKKRRHKSTVQFNGTAADRPIVLNDMDENE